MDETEVSAHAFCDAEAMSCGILLIALMKAIGPLEPGQVLEVRALDPSAPLEIPSWCKLAGHELLAGPCGQDNARYFIRKGAK